ncbi:unnamed protein product [Cylicocyclus nassatus]|uniref:BPTI/Kunitz inhibitor domain-containing protein n=1 Tax=Cylicocyclus nassatus TaxID=53992 RepID=A0AA36DTI2_CYLNA|nr:unnamed protein product [Cylicocyclus nassatus]
MFVVALILSLVCLSVLQPKESDERIHSCAELLDRGNSNCTVPKAGLRWYYDSELDDCFEYYFEGCDGGNNTFFDYRSCRRTCIPADRSRCGGNAKATSTCERLNTTCPEGSECNRVIITLRNQRASCTQLEGQYAFVILSVLGYIKIKCPKYKERVNKYIEDFRTTIPVAQS